MLTKSSAPYGVAKPQLDIIDNANSVTQTFAFFMLVWGKTMWIECRKPQVDPGQKYKVHSPDEVFFMSDIGKENIREKPNVCNKTKVNIKSNWKMQQQKYTQKGPERNFTA